MKRLALFLFLFAIQNCTTTVKTTDPTKAVMRPAFASLNQSQINGTLNVKMEIGNNNIEGEFKQTYIWLHPIKLFYSIETEPVKRAIDDAIIKSNAAAFYHISSNTTREKDGFEETIKTVVIGRPIVYKDSNGPVTTPNSINRQEGKVEGGKK